MPQSEKSSPPAPHPFALALFQPDIPQNTGTIIRMAACLAIPVHIIEPAGFPVSDRAFRRAGMDYLDAATLHRHVAWEAFEDWRRSVGARLVLATTRAATPYARFDFAQGDVLLLGRESAGVPDAVHDRADARIVIPMHPPLRSLNLAVSAAMLAGEALRQLDGYAKVTE